MRAALGAAFYFNLPGYTDGVRKKEKKKNPVCVILWRDAAYSTLKRFPKGIPPLQLTSGLIISSNRRFTIIATNVNYNPRTKTLWPVDGFVIPEKAIVAFRKIGNPNV